MDVHFLGWASVELRAADGGDSLVIDLLGDPGWFPPFREAVRGETVAPSGPVGAALITHLHFDHADPAALTATLPAGAPVLAPEPATGSGLETAAVDASEHALREGGFALRRVVPWETAELGPFTVIAVPAVDGTGELQVSWVVEADGVRVLHAGDTIWHGWWWAIASRLGPIDCALLPANGVEIDFPHKQPATSVPAALTPEQAVEAAYALRARRLVPMHYGTYFHERLYREREDVPGAVRRAADARGVDVEILAPGETLSLAAATAA